MKTAEEVTIPALAWILAQAPNQDDVAEAIRESCLPISTHSIKTEPQES